MIHPITGYIPTHCRLLLRRNHIISLDKANNITNKLWTAAQGGDVQIVLEMAYKGWIFKKIDKL